MTTDRQPPHITVTGPSRDPMGKDLQFCAPLTVAEARAVLLQLPEGRCRGELASARRKIQRVADEGDDQMARLFEVEIKVRTLAAFAQPRPGARLMDDGRWRFVDTIIAASPADALRYFQHFVTTPPAPVAVEGRVTRCRDHRDPEAPWRDLDGYGFVSTVRDSPYWSHLVALGVVEVEPTQ